MLKPCANVLFNLVNNLKKIHSNFALSLRYHNGSV